MLDCLSFVGNQWAQLSEWSLWSVVFFTTHLPTPCSQYFFFLQNHEEKLWSWSIFLRSAGWVSGPREEIVGRIEPAGLCGWRIIRCWHQKNGRLAWKKVVDQKHILTRDEPQGVKRMKSGSVRLCGALWKNGTSNTNRLCTGRSL